MVSVGLPGPGPRGAAGPGERRRQRAEPCSGLQFLHLPSCIHSKPLQSVHSRFSPGYWLLFRVTSHLAIAKDGTVRCSLCTCSHVPFLVYAFHKWCSVCYYCLKPKLAFDICHTPVPGKVNSVLESTAFRSTRRCVGKARKRNQSVWGGAKTYYLTTWLPFMKNIPCNHGAFVLLSFAFRSLQAGHSF